MPRIIYVEHETCELLNEAEDAKVPTPGEEIQITPVGETILEWRSVLHVVPNPSYVEVRTSLAYRIPSCLAELTEEQRHRLYDMLSRKLYPDDRVHYEFSDLMVSTIAQALFTTWRLSIMGGGHTRTHRNVGLVDEMSEVIFGTPPRQDHHKVLRNVGDLRRAMAGISDSIPLMVRGACGLDFAEKAGVDTLKRRTRLAPREELQNPGINVFVVGVEGDK